MSEMENNTNKPIKTRKRSYMFAYILAAVVLLAGVILISRFAFQKRTINASILKNEIYLNEELVYADNTPRASKWLWEFGNGDISDKQSGKYRFDKAGAYIVRVTVDDKLQQQFPVSVRDTVQTKADTSVTISGPAHGVVGEQVRMEAEGNASIFEWSFGETGSVDMMGRTAFYIYQNEGTFLVKLSTGRSPRPVVHKITITDPYAEDDIVVPGEGEQKVINDIKQRLQYIASGEDFNTHYYYLVDNYMCNDEKLSVAVDAGGQKKQTDFYSYCMSLTFGDGIVIDDAQIALRPNSDCPSRLTVKQHVNK